MADGERRYEDGAALLVAVLILALMGIIGLSSMETVTRDRQVAGYQSRAQTALYAAEAGVAFGMGLLRRDAQDLAEQGVGALEDYDPSERIVVFVHARAEAALLALLPRTIAGEVG